MRKAKHTAKRKNNSLLLPMLLGVALAGMLLHLTSD